MSLIVDDRYVDFDLKMTAHPVTGDISTLKGVSAVKRAILNLIETKFYDISFEPELGSSFNSMLSEYMTPINAKIAEGELRTLVENFEPRAKIVSVQVSTIDTNTHIIMVVDIAGEDRPTQINAILKRAR